MVPNAISKHGTVQLFFSKPFLVSVCLCVQADIFCRYTVDSFTVCQYNKFFFVVVGVVLFFCKDICEAILPGLM